jgi:hypothetical protein
MSQGKFFAIKNDRGAYPRKCVFVFQEENKLELFFEIVGGENAESLKPKIDELIKDGCVLQGFHCGAISKRSPLSNDDWWNKVNIMFYLGAKVAAVLQSPEPSAFPLHYIS